MDPITVLTGAALATATVASGISAMISWWNWKHLKVVVEDVKTMKKHSQQQLLLGVKADMKREADDASR